MFNFFCYVIIKMVIAMRFERTKKMNISVLKEQEKQLSSKEKIQEALLDENVLGFNICLDDLVIGFVMVKQFAPESYFLWDYAIGYNYQNKNYGTTALKEFIKFMEANYNMKVLTTTYIWGNSHAKHIYEKIGFIETDIVNQQDCHEVNMIYNCTIKKR